MMKKALLAILIGSALVVVGCGDKGSGDLNKQDDAALRGNLNRPLNAEELKQMGAKPDGNAGSAPAAPPKKQGG